MKKILAQKIAFGERRGQRVKRVGFRQEADVMEFKGPRCAALSGFSLHAPRRVGSEDRRNLSQLINYMARPPITENRLERTATGDNLYKLKTSWNDGTISIQLSPSELIEKLIALIAPRRSPLLRFGGVFVPNFKRRDEIIPGTGKRKRKSELEIIAEVLDPIQIARYLKHTGMPAAPPARAGVKMRKMRIVCEEWC